MHELSPEQATVVGFAVANPKANVAVKAYAGSGKTSTLVALAEAKPQHQSILAVAFARPNALDFKKVMPFTVNSGTLHSFCLQACKDTWGAVKVQPNKTYKLGDKLGLRVNKEFPKLPRLLGFAKSQGIIPYATLGEEFISQLPVTHSFTEDTDENWLNIFDRLSVTSEFSDADMMELCRKFLAESIRWAMPIDPKIPPVLDYDDMIYNMACFSDGENLPKPRVLLVDEAQDLDPNQHACIKFMGAKPTTQVILVGDPNQAIYAFRGADAESFETLIEHFDCERFALSYTFRSDLSITEQAQRYVPDMKTFSRNEGQVVTLANWSADIVHTGSAILCRNTAPLVGIFYKLIKHGVPAKIKGTEIGKGLISVLKSKVRGKTVREVRKGIADWYIAEENKAQAKGYAHRIAIIIEQAAILQAVLDRCARLNNRDTDVKLAMIGELDAMFTDDVPKVCLATIHKAKGLEWDSVFFLDDWLIPSKYAEQPWELQQEDNLAYVAITRAKRSLLYVDTKGFVDNE